jgi:hypothetical protein
MSNNNQTLISDSKVNKPIVLNCAICLEDIESNLQFLPCIHPFHDECINGWLHEQPVCPICKVPVYVNTADQLARYNQHKSQLDMIADEEARFFQQISAGLYNTEQPVDHSDHGHGDSGRVPLNEIPIENHVNQPTPNHLHDVRDNIRIQYLNICANLHEQFINIPSDDPDHNYEGSVLNIINSINETYNDISDSDDNNLPDLEYSDGINQITSRDILNIDLNQINEEIISNINNEQEFSDD